MMFNRRASLSFGCPFDDSGLRQLLQTFASVVLCSMLPASLGLDVELALDLRLEAVEVGQRHDLNVGVKRMLT